MWTMRGFSIYWYPGFTAPLVEDDIFLHCIFGIFIKTWVPADIWGLYMTQVYVFGSVSCHIYHHGSLVLEIGFGDNSHSIHFVQGYLLYTWPCASMSVWIQFFLCLWSTALRCWIELDSQIDFCRLSIFTWLILIHDYGRFFYHLMSFSISFFSDLNFSL